MHNFDYRYSPDANWSEILALAVTLRKHLHKNPELTCNDALIPEVVRVFSQLTSAPCPTTE